MREFSLVAASLGTSAFESRTTFFRTKLFGDGPTIIMEGEGEGVDEGRERKNNGAKGEARYEIRKEENK